MNTPRIHGVTEKSFSFLSIKQTSNLSHKKKVMNSAFSVALCLRGELLFVRGATL
jgi:hypothetical protein